MGLKFTPGRVTLPQLRRIAREAPALALAADCRARVDAGAAIVQAVLDRGETVYGLNTGFGAMARTLIDTASLRELQCNLVLSHCTGTGKPLADEVVRLVLALKAVALATGNSGVRWVLVEALLALHNHAVWPVIPAKGSVGASGDLAPLAHLAAVLLGVGEVRCNGELLPAAEGLERAGLEPVELAPKEGLALLNGTQVSTALALSGLFAIEDAFAGAVVTGALSVDAALGSDEPFDSRIQALRGQSGQSAVAECYRGLLAGSEIRESHRDCEKVQDPYSLRCQPQVMATRSRTRPESWSAKRMRSPTTHWCFPMKATSCRAATSTPSRSPWRPTTWRWRQPKSVQCRSGGWRCWSTTHLAGCRRSWSRRAVSTPVSWWRR